VDGAGCFYSVHSRHVHVHRHDIRPQGTHQLQGRRAVGCFPDDLDVGLLKELECNAVPNDGMVVHEENPDLGHCSALRPVERT